MQSKDAEKEGLPSARLKARRLEQEVTKRLSASIHRLRSNTLVGPIPDVAEWPTELDPEEYMDHRRFAEDHLMASILSKATTFETDGDTELQARIKFFDAETRNRLTNVQLAKPDQPTWVAAVSREFCRILGPLDEATLNRIADDSGFGPGSCVGVTGDLVPSKKFDSRPVMTEELVPLFPALAGSFVTSYWFQPDCMRLARGNHHFTVLKNREADRNAAKEPLWNSKLQNGIGRQFARRLKLFGVDIHDQGRNQLLAQLARVLGLSTLDLSQASDLICHMCIWLLLTINESRDGLRWWHLLNLARSKMCRIKRPGESHNTWHQLEMFCSMGNGFTFALESALFLAVCRTVVGVDQRHHLAVYGDDMIVPQGSVAEVVERLEYLGFKVNTRKSCLAGRFFESCGSDWFDSQPVRPFFLRWDNESPVPYPLQIANALRLWCFRVYGCCPSEFRSLWRWLKGQVPKAFCNPVPIELGDVGLISSLDEYLSGEPESLAKSWPWFEGWNVRHAHVTSVDVDKRSFGVLAYALDNAASTDATLDTNLDPLLERRPPGWLRSVAIAAKNRDPGMATRGCEAVRNQYGKVLTKKSQVSQWHSADLTWVD